MAMTQRLLRQAGYRTQPLALCTQSRWYGTVACL
jgi:hypothetical protein